MNTVTPTMPVRLRSCVTTKVPMAAMAPMRMNRVLSVLVSGVGLSGVGVLGVVGVVAGLYHSSSLPMADPRALVALLARNIPAVPQLVLSMVWALQL